MTIRIPEQDCSILSGTKLFSNVDTRKTQILTSGVKYDTRSSKTMPPTCKCATSNGSTKSKKEKQQKILEGIIGNKLPNTGIIKLNKSKEESNGANKQKKHPLPEEPHPQTWEKVVLFKKDSHQKDRDQVTRQPLLDNNKQAQMEKQIQEVSPQVKHPLPEEPHPQMSEKVVLCKDSNQKDRDQVTGPPLLNNNNHQWTNRCNK